GGTPDGRPDARHRPLPKYAEPKADGHPSDEKRHCRDQHGQRAAGGAVFDHAQQREDDDHDEVPQKERGEKAAAGSAQSPGQRPSPPSRNSSASPSPST